MISSMALLLALLSAAAPPGAAEGAVHRVDLGSGGIGAAAVEPPPGEVQVDPASLPKKLPPEPAQTYRKLHPRLERWIRERDPNERVNVVIAFEDRVKVPHFPALDPGLPRDAPENQQALAASEKRVQELKETRGSTYHRRRQELAAYGAEVVETFWLIDAVVASMPLGHVPMLALHDDVLAIVPVDSGEPPPRSSPDGKAGNDVIVGREEIGSDPWKLGLNQGYIGLLDTGLWFSHVQLQLPTRIDFRRDCVNGGDDCNTGTRLNPVDDCYDHGTSTAAILAGNDSRFGRFDGITNITLDSFKVYPSTIDEFNRCPGLDSAAAVRGFQAAVRALDSVIVAEVQGEGGTHGPMSVAANAAFDAGAVVIAANGNFANPGTTAEPASAARVLGVGAYDVLSDTTISVQSRGPTADKRVKPDIQAPTNTETASTGCGAIRCMPGSNVDFQIYDGTSGATPYAAGAAALLRNLIGRLTGNWSVDPGLVYALMILSGEKTDFDNVRGAGPIRLPNNGTLRWGEVAVRHGQMLEIPIHFNPAQGHLDAAIWWPEDGVQCRHNDIDLRIVDPMGVVKASSISIPSVFERVRFQGTMQDRWSVQIHGYSVDRYGPQKVYFAIFNRPTPPP